MSVERIPELIGEEVGVTGDAGHAAHHVLVQLVDLLGVEHLQLQGFNRCSVQRAACSVQRAACSVQCAACTSTTTNLIQEFVSVPPLGRQNNSLVG